MGKILKVISTIISSHKNSRKAMKNPEFQRTDGDWINFKIPGTDLSIPMIQTGFGDGVYPAYFGYDENKNICELVVQYIAIEMAFGDEDE